MKRNRELETERGNPVTWEQIGFGFLILVVLCLVFLIGGVLYSYGYSACNADKNEGLRLDKTCDEDDYDYGFRVGVFVASFFASVIIACAYLLIVASKDNELGDDND